MPVTTRKGTLNPTRGGKVKGRGGGQVGAQDGRANKRKRPNRDPDSTTSANLGKYRAAPLEDDEDEEEHDEEEANEGGDDDNDSDFRERAEDARTETTDSEQEEEDDHHNRRQSRPSDKAKETRQVRQKRSTIHTETHQRRQPTQEKLTVDNYREVGRQLGRPALEQLLADPNRKINNRPPPKVLAEAQGLQGYYSLDKMSLALAGCTSLRTLESCL